MVERDGLIAVVKVTFESGGSRLDIPGGGIDPGETPQQAAARECGEEAGLLVKVGEQIARADHYFVNEKGQSNNTRGVFFAAEVVGLEPALKTEADHSLLWMSPDAALAALDRESHVWALARWIRRARR